MPQAPYELQKRWTDDSAALSHLAPNFTWRGGMIRPRDGYTPTQEDYSAIDYLILEWDYGFERGKH